MNLTRQKQFALLKLGAAMVIVLFALWFFLIHSAQIRLNKQTKAADELLQTTDAKNQVIQRKAQVQAQMRTDGQKLRSIEAQMVTGDIYLWIEKTLRDFEIPEQLEFSRYDPPQIMESGIPIDLPYKTASFTVAGMATYHDLGTFLANLENSYPHIRIRRLEMEPATLGVTSKSEKLSFTLEMHVLVGPGNNSGSKPRP